MAEDQRKKARIALAPAIVAKHANVATTVAHFIDYMYCNLNALNDEDDERNVFFYNHCLEPFEFFCEFQKHLTDEIILATAIKSGTLELVLHECMNYDPKSAHAIAASYAMYLPPPILEQMGAAWLPTQYFELQQQTKFGLLPNRASIRHLRVQNPHAIWNLDWRELNNHHHDIALWWVMLSCIDRGLFRADNLPREFRLLVPLPPHLRYRVLRCYFYDGYKGRYHNTGFGDIMTDADGAFKPVYIRRALAELFGEHEPRPYEHTKYILADYLDGNRSRTLRFEMLCRGRQDDNGAFKEDLVDCLFDRMYSTLGPQDHYHREFVSSQIFDLAPDKKLEVLDQFRARFSDPADLTIAIKTRVYEHVLRYTLSLENVDAYIMVLQRALTVPDAFRAAIPDYLADDIYQSVDCLHEWHDLLPDRRNLKFFLKRWRAGHDAIRSAFTPAMHAYFDAITLFVIVLQIEEGYFTTRDQDAPVARFAQMVTVLPEELQVRICIAAHPDMGEYRAEVVRGYRFRPEYVTRAMKEIFEITETHADYRRIRTVRSVSDSSDAEESDGDLEWLEPGDEWGL